jgi:secreted PhoX family phosphatase
MSSAAIDVCQIEDACDPSVSLRRSRSSNIIRRDDIMADAPALDATQIVRILTVPTGAEVTGLEFINGEMMFNAQHPDPMGAPQASVGISHSYDWHQFPRENAQGVPAQSGDQYAVAYGTYQTIAVMGDTLPGSGHILGEISLNATDKFLSDDPDFNGFVPTNDQATEGYVFTSWENRPAGISRLQIKKKSDGSWELVKGEMLDTMGVKGVWVLCFGTVTPWSTPLHSEELYEDSTESWIKQRTTKERYTDLNKHIDGIANPYDYGFIVEIQNAKSESDYKIVKHRTMGRFSHENAEVMADRKTVYLSDDGTDTVLFKFVADTAEDLSSGTLYAGKMTQDSGSQNSAVAGFDIEWIKLGKGSNDDIAAWSALYDGEDKWITDDDITKQATDDTKPFSDDRAAFLETRKFAKAMGATAEWKKMEGLRYNPRVPKAAYLAMSSVGNGMSDDTGDVQVSENYCGVVYKMRIQNNFNIDRMEPVVAGKPIDDNGKKMCHEDYISNPDNILVLNDGRVVIGEDTSKHANNMAWIWQAGYTESSGNPIGTTSVISPKPTDETPDKPTDETPDSTNAGAIASITSGLVAVCAAIGIYMV